MAVNIVKKYCAQIKYQGKTTLHNLRQKSNPPVAKLKKCLISIRFKGCVIPHNKTRKQIAPAPRERSSSAIKTTKHKPSPSRGVPQGLPPVTHSHRQPPAPGQMHGRARKRARHTRGSRARRKDGATNEWPPICSIPLSRSARARRARSQIRRRLPPSHVAPGSGRSPHTWAQWGTQFHPRYARPRRRMCRPQETPPPPPRPPCLNSRCVPIWAIAASSPFPRPCALVWLPPLRGS